MAQCSSRFPLKQAVVYPANGSVIGFWPIPLIIAMMFALESPWWLVRHGRLGEAERSARRLSSAEPAKRAPELVANMVRVTKLEQEEAKAIGNSSWLELFKGSDLRRTESHVSRGSVGFPCIRIGRVFRARTLIRGT